MTECSEFFEHVPKMPLEMPLETDPMWRPVMYEERAGSSQKLTKSGSFENFYKLNTLAQVK